MDAPLDRSLLAAGAALCAWGAVRTLRSVVDHWRRGARRAADFEASKQAFVAEVAAASVRARARHHQGLAWDGQRPLRVAAIVDEAPEVKSFYLTSDDGRPLPAFLPGQYLTFHLPEADGPVVRCYSLSDRPHEEYYRVSVKREGRGSTYWHDRVEVGSTVQAQAPRGAFFLDPADAAPVVLVAGGIGVTPILSMLLAIEQTRPQRDVYLFYGVQNRGAHPFKRTLEEAAQRCGRLRLFVAYSRPDDASVYGRDYQHASRIDADYLRRALPSSNFQFYLCGPGEMMQSLVSGLLDWGVPDDAIHYEAFGPATVQRRDAERAGAVGATVRFARSGREAVWDGEWNSLLELAESVGAIIDAGCRAGNCGACATRVVDGGVCPIKAAGAQPPAGECLACISAPSGPLVLDA
ncbi:Flavohemoprotein [Pirellulimonas nuda]|uniref:Flavohemoprotein n=1 Tax=Pirellulimonas nuda TaxID=2528009 RepID=A0A518D748_9BACT|nr:2Fe-2S iron-sulfur cluster-binding protein [Pirellulimonas nuda]QDU87281.1 Flavohemoprotein [Pirellulimonas nuda]